MRIDRSDRSRGVTALELLLVLSVILLLASFASFNRGDTSAESEMGEAVENLESSIRLARQTALVFQTDVILHLQTDKYGRDLLFYSVPESNAPQGYLKVDKRTYEFPKSVHLMAEQEALRFDLNGTVDPPAQLVLASRSDQNLVRRILVE